MDRWRSKYATATVIDVEVTTIAIDDAAVDLEEDIAAMQRELTRLPVTEREVLTLLLARTVAR